MSSSSGALSPEQHVSPPSEHLRYVRCSLCDTVLQVSVPSSNLYGSVTVRCGNCESLLYVNMRAYRSPAAANPVPPPEDDDEDEGEGEEDEDESDEDDYE